MELAREALGPEWYPAPLSGGLRRPRSSERPYGPEWSGSPTAPNPVANSPKDGGASNGPKHPEPHYTPKQIKSSYVEMT